VLHIFFVARKIENELKKLKKRRFLISTPLGDAVTIKHVYMEIKIIIRGYDAKVDVMPLELYDFDVILGMDWLSNHKA
jgi:hypothetical protein